jgi:hypothetical protein
MKRPVKTPAAGKTPGTHGRLPDLPRLVPLSDGQRVFGPSRATWYRAAKAGQIRMVKVGRATFLDTESVLAFLANLPAVTLQAAA